MNRRKIGLLVLALLIAGVTAAITLDPAARVQGWLNGEPAFQDHSATAWRRDLKQPDEAGRATAMTALVAGKGEAVPVCVWLLEKAPEPEVRFRAADILGQIGKEGTTAGPALVAALADPDPMVREVSITAVGKLAPNVPGAVPALVKLFPKDLAIRAVAEFKQAGAEAVPSLIPLLSHSEALIRWNAGRTLGKIGEPAMPAIPQLIQQMEKDNDPLVREHGAEALGDIGAKAATDPAVVPALAKALKDSDQRVRRDSVRALGKMGPAAKPVLGEVTALTNDPVERVKAAARDAVKLIDPSKK